MRADPAAPMSFFSSWLASGAISGKILIIA
jgi:hypothetical protein